MLEVPVTKAFYPKQLENFFNSLKDKGSQMRCVKEAAETIKLNIQWMDKNLDTLKNWL